MHEAVALAMLAVVLVAAVARPRGLPEAVFALPAALVVVAAGALPVAHARAEVAQLGPVVGFLAAVLALADACAAEGVFAAAGAVIARHAGTRGGRPLLVAVFAAAATTTAVLSLDTTVVLLTPVVLATARRAGVPARPHLYACLHLANSGSLLLPVSNLTNLLALAVVPVSFLRFTALMALPWLVAVALTFLAFAAFFRRDLAAPPQPPVVPPVPVPRFAVTVVALTLAGFVVTSVTGVEPVWAAAAGALVLAGKRLAQRRTDVRHVVRSAAPLFCVFVLALGVVVRAVGDDGLDSVVRALLPDGGSLGALLATAAVAAVVANVVNNLPATLLLLPVAAAAGGVPAVLAVLVGVNVGPNLSYPGSLATLLWRRSLAGTGVPSLGEFTVLGAVTAPAVLVAATVTLWAAVRVVGAG